MLELRPLGGGGKDAAVAALLAGEEIAAAVYAGDDRTDLDAFRRLRELREEGELRDGALRRRRSPPEAPPELAEECDLAVDGPDGWLAPARGAGRVAMPYTDLLRVTVLLTGAEATALAAITAVAANRDSDTTTLTVAAAWWLIALVVGFYLGRPSRAADGLRDALARARTATSLPPESPARIAFARLWPIAPHRDRRRRPRRLLPRRRRDRRRLRPARLARLAHAARRPCWRSSSATGSSSTSSPTPPCARSSSSARPGLRSSRRAVPE